MKTQAFMMDASGGPRQHAAARLDRAAAGAAARRAVHAVSRRRSIGTDPEVHRRACTTSSCRRKHAEIKAENGVWVLRDAGSTNGTYVNDRRVDRHELVDNDFIKFG